MPDTQVQSEAQVHVSGVLEYRDAEGVVLSRVAIDTDIELEEQDHGLDV